MGKIKFKKPDIKGCFGKLKSLKWADMKNGIRAMKKRQAEKEAAYRNSRFAQKMQKLYPYMNRYSLILHGIWAIAINFLIEQCPVILWWRQFRIRVFPRRHFCIMRL